MKTLLTFLSFYSFIICGYAQSPEKISYQAIVRNLEGELVSNQQITVKINILQGASNGTSIYEETHGVETNENGLFSIEIGAGSTSNKLSDITWSVDQFFVETQIDLTGGTNFALFSTTQLLSVPYALHANSAGELISEKPVFFQANIVSFSGSRAISDLDVNNTLECTADATLTISKDFELMKIGDVIHLEAHNGADLEIDSEAGVEINYVLEGTATISSSPNQVQFGILRKANNNHYIISGQ